MAARLHWSINAASLDCTINTAKQAINCARQGRGQRRVRARRVAGRGF